jgi:hypothetical protein
MSDKQNEPDLQPFDGTRCKHINTHKLLDSELHYCLRCGVLLTAPMEIETDEDGRGGAI